MMFVSRQAVELFSARNLNGRSSSRLCLESWTRTLSQAKAKVVTSSLQHSIRLIVFLALKDVTRRIL